MKNNHVFPYDAVKRDSNIIIYGLGFLGKLYIEQIERTNYCRIEAVSDQNNKKNYKNYRFVEINKIKEETVANIIIAISDVDIASNAYWSLVSVGVDEKRIVSAYQTNIGLFPCYRPESEPAVMVKRIRVAVTLAGGIGDYVVFISFVRKLIDVVPDATIDIYGNKTIVEAVFPRISNVSKVFNDDEESIKSNKLRKN